MLRRILIVALVLLAASVLGLAIPTSVGGFSYCAQRGESDLQVFMVADAAQRVLHVGGLHLARAGADPPPIPPPTQQDLQVSMPMFTVAVSPISGIDTSRFAYAVGSGPNKCAVVFHDVVPDDQFTFAYCTADSLFLFLLSAAFATYPTIALHRGPLRRWRRRRQGLCFNCGYNLAGNESGICPECGTPQSSCPTEATDTVTRKAEPAAQAPELEPRSGARS